MIWCTGSSARARALLSWASAPAAACGAVAADAGAGLGSLAAASVDVLPYWQGLQSGVAQLGVGQPGDACHGCRLQSAANGGHHGDLLSCADDPDGGGEQQRPPRAAALQPRCASSASSTTVAAGGPRCARALEPFAMRFSQSHAHEARPCDCLGGGLPRRRTRRRAGPPNSHTIWSSPRTMVLASARGTSLAVTPQ